MASDQASRGWAGCAKENSAKCKRCGKTAHKSVRCSDLVCGVCGGKSHSVEVCANVVTFLPFEKSFNDESDAAISGEEEEAFVCDVDSLGV